MYQLSEDERRTLELLSMDCRADEIAEIMRCGVDGVYQRIYRLRVKFGADTTHGLVALAFRVGVLDRKIS